MPGKGLDELQRRQEERSAARAAMNGPRMNEFFIPVSKMAANFRFLTDGDDLLIADFHGLWITTPRKKRLLRFVMCTEDESCTLCSDPDEERSKKKTLAAALIWQYNFEHDERPSIPDVKAVQKGRQTIFVQDINEVRLWYINYYGQLDVMNFFNEYGTLCNRNYKIRREGQSGSVQYPMTPLDPSPFNVDVPEHPSIEEVIRAQSERALGHKLGQPHSTNTESYEDDKSTAEGSGSDEEDPFDRVRGRSVEGTADEYGF